MSVRDLVVRKELLNVNAPERRCQVGPCKRVGVNGRGRKEAEIRSSDKNGWKAKSNECKWNTELNCRR